MPLPAIEKKLPMSTVSRFSIAAGTAGAPKLLLLHGFPSAGICSAT